MKSRLLIVDDEPNIRASFESLLTDEGHEVRSSPTVAEAIELLNDHDFELVLLDLSFPAESGLDLLRKLPDLGEPVVLVVSGQSEIATALKAVGMGAADYLEKPVAADRLIAAVNGGLLLSRARRHQRLTTDQIDTEARMIGQSRSMKELGRTIGKVAPTDSSVLVSGPNGTGKELVATRLYLDSLRRNQPFIKVNCPGVPETLFESELFGHRRGAFTGAVRDYPGKFAMADGGTIFLDEIGDLPLACQAKLLRVIETGEVDRLGCEQSQTVDVRLICATNRDLPNLIAQQQFRQDLFYRISVFTIEVPPLRSRKSDIPPLVSEFLRRFDPSGSTELTAEALVVLTEMDFPGNVRQLKNIIERAVILCQGRTVSASDLRRLTGHVRSQQPESDEIAGLSERLVQHEKEIVVHALKLCQGNISKAARILKIDRANLSRKIKQMGLKAR